MTESLRKRKISGAARRSNSSMSVVNDKLKAVEFGGGCETRSQKRVAGDHGSSNKNYANVTRKKCTGATNWQKFLLEENVKKVLEGGVPKVVHSGKTGPRLLTEENGRKNNEVRKVSKNVGGRSPKLTNVVGMDCEMVGIGDNGRESILARVSVVNNDGATLYDKFVKPREPVTDYRTYVSGVREEDLVNAEDFLTVQREVADLISNRILVGHAIKNDLDVLFITHPRRLLRDTANFFRKRGARTPSLKSLAAEYLHVKIQDGEHSPVQDAKAAVQLYNLYRKEWEKGLAKGQKRNVHVDSTSHKSAAANSH